MNMIAKKVVKVRPGSGKDKVNALAVAIGFDELHNVLVLKLLHVLDI